MRYLIATPQTNERGPKFMEKALAAIHQGLPAVGSVSFEYGEHDGRIGLFVNCANDLEQVITNPLIANYPQSVLEDVPEAEIPSDWYTWQADLRLNPDLFPILRHAQFEDLANRSFADPIDGLLRAATSSPTLKCSILIEARRKSSRARLRALEAVRRLNGRFLRHHHRIAHWYTEQIVDPRVWPIAWVVGRLCGSGEEVTHNRVLETSTSRLHEREDDLQAANDIRSTPSQHKTSSARLRMQPLA